MILDVLIIVLLIFTIIYGYVKGCIKIVAKLVSLVVALMLAYIMAGQVGRYILNTEFGGDVRMSIENRAVNELDKVEQESAIYIIKEKFSLNNDKVLVDKIVDYVFIGMGFIVVFVIARIVLWAGQKILENVFELPVLRTFNKLGGVVAAVALYITEISIILSIIKMLTTFAFMNGVVEVIQSSVITRFIYEHNICTKIILSKIF